MKWGKLNSFRTTTRFVSLCPASLQLSSFFFKQDQYQNFMVRLMQSKSPFQGWRLVCFHSNTVFLKNNNSLLHSVHTYKIWNRSVEKYKSYGKVSMTTYFLSVFCEAHGGQQCIEAQPGVVQYGQQTTRH